MDKSTDPLVDRLVYLVARWGLVTPAIAFLEANKPLSFVDSQALLMLQPLTDLFGASEQTKELAVLLADRDRVGKLIASLEAVENQE